MFRRALAFREANTHVVDDYATFKRVMDNQRGFVLAPWCGSPACEERIKEETRATIRVIPEGNAAASGSSCVYCGQPAHTRALFAQAY
jgi:prolyl-tRNA synthetase